MLIHHSFGFPDIFLKGGSWDPKDPPGSAPALGPFMQHLILASLKLCENSRYDIIYGKSQNGDRFGVIII